MGFGVGFSGAPHVFLAAAIPIWTQASLDTGALTVRITMARALDPGRIKLVFRLEKAQGRLQATLDQAARVRERRDGLIDFDVAVESDGAADARVWTRYEGLDEPVSELAVEQSLESGAFKLVRRVVTTGAEKRRLILQFLRDRAPTGRLAGVEDIASGTGIAEQDVSDQIDVLAGMGAVTPHRTIGGGAWPTLTGQGRLLLEQMEEGSPFAAVRSVAEISPEHAVVEFKWDAFIAHASEDKVLFANELAAELRKRELRIWYDDFVLKVGDSLREKIDEGLRLSKYGIVILSTNFFRKKWPRRELDGLTTLERGDRKVILPVWLGIGFQDVQHLSPSLAGLVAAKASDGIETVVGDLLAVLRP